MPQVDIITGDKRVRQWTQEEKLSIVEAAFAPGAVAAHMAKRVNVSTGQLYTWRKQLMSRKPSGGNGFARVVTVTETAVPGPKLSPPSPATEPTSLAALSVPALPVTACDLPAIEVEVRGDKVRIPGSMPPALATAVLRALVRR
jgi:transposase